MHDAIMNNAFVEGSAGRIVDGDNIVITSVQLVIENRSFTYGDRNSIQSTILDMTPAFVGVVAPVVQMGEGSSVLHDFGFERNCKAQSRRPLV
mmetsp:Transcript_20677/g.43443  ORF Transcript_20677/g.43443 Transcript_20677/m.43443 type:complete len:93 (+) Transcript_20677:1311-1589(+)